MSLTQSNSYTTKRSLKSTLRNGPCTGTTQTKTTGPYNRNFQQHLIDNGVYPHAYRHPDGRVPAKPDNWEEINQILSKPRPSLSSFNFLEEAHERFIQADANAAKEKQVTTLVIPIIEGDIEDARCVSGGIPFTNLDPLIDGTLVPGNPDLYYGARPEQLDRRVRDELSGHIIPSTQDNLPMAPNFFLAAKGPDGSLAVAGRQASYDGALGARGMCSLQSYGREDASYFNKAYTLTSLYHGGSLKMFTTYPSQQTSSRSQPGYLMHQLNAWCITGNIETFRQGVTYYRNGKDWTKKQRDEAIRRANEKVNKDCAKTLATDTCFAQASSFASEATSDKTYTIEAFTKESRTSRIEESNTNAETTETLSDEPLVDQRASAQRSRGLLESPSRPKRKRRNTDDSYDNPSQ
ncbi:hypothetical protein MMC25_007364 [Agyrium rufum]|nr:hypothetical protein [Agyrium rufum]